jgi:hypothetical protein
MDGDLSLKYPETRTGIISNGMVSLHLEKSEQVACRKCVKDRKFCIKKLGEGNIVLTLSITVQKYRAPQNAARLRPTDNATGSISS